MYINTNTTKQEKKYEEIPSIEELFNFLMTIIQKDKKILSEKDIFDNVLKLLHILIVIKIKKNENKIELKQIYDTLINLIYKINNFNSRLLLAIILHEFSVMEKDEAVWQLQRLPCVWFRWAYRRIWLWKQHLRLLRPEIC